MMPIIRRLREIEKLLDSQPGTPKTTGWSSHHSRTDQLHGRVSYGLYVIVMNHFTKEEEVYLPLLDARLTEQEAAAMFEAMDRAEQGVRCAWWKVLETR
jgi:hypothetical protein